MKSQTKQLIILAVVLAAALAVYVGLRLWNGEKQAADAGDETQQDLVELTDLAQLSFTAESGETLSFTKQEDAWVSGDEPELPLDQDLLDAIEAQFCGLAYERALEEHDALADYGLDPAARTVTGTDASGTACTVLLGDEVDYEGIYYAMVEGSDVVYTVSGSLFNAISYDLMGLAQTQTLPELGEDTIQSITLAAGGSELTLNKLTENTQQIQEQETGEMDENGDPVLEEVTVNVDVYHWFLSDDLQVPEGNAALSDVLDELSALQFSSVYTFQPTEEELADLGLAGDAAVLTVECTDGSRFQLVLGNLDETGESCYARADGSDLIHLIASSKVDSLLAMTEETLTAAAE